MNYGGRAPPMLCALICSANPPISETGISGRGFIPAFGPGTAKLLSVAVEGYDSYAEARFDSG